MEGSKRYFLKAKIYTTGINFCLDVPQNITAKLEIVKGYIKVKGFINHFSFKKSLVPVKNCLYRLFVNTTTLKGGQLKVGEPADIVLEQDLDIIEKFYPLPGLLKRLLKEKKLTADFDRVSNARKKEILKYLSYIKTEETLLKNYQKLINQLEQKENRVRIP